MNFLTKSRKHKEATNMRPKITTIGSYTRKAIFSAINELDQRTMAEIKATSGRDLCESAVIRTHVKGEEVWKAGQLNTDRMRIVARKGASV